MNDTISSFVDDAVARIGDRFYGHESALRGRIEKPIHAAYQRGRHDALSELMPVADVAVTLGVDTSHIHRLARTHEIGWTIGRERLFTPDDVERLRNRPDRRRKILAPAEQDAI